MATKLTFQSADTRRCRMPHWPMALAAMLFAAAAPVVACEKTAPQWVAGAESESRSEATFTGEFVNGAPVYQLPAIMVVARRDAEVARTQRNDTPVHAKRSPASAKPAVSMPKRKVSSAPPEASAVKPCVG